jgi:hypothetical protein
VTGVTPNESLWDGVDELTCEVVGAAADLLATLRKGYADQTVVQPFRAFATTMCLVVAHLTRAEHCIATCRAPERSTPGVNEWLMDQARAAWRSAVFALNTSTSLIPSVQATGGVGGVLELFELEPTVARLLALHDELVAMLAAVEPATAG